MTAGLWAYVAAWCLVSLGGLGLLWWGRGRFVITRTAYWRWLGRPWRLTTFAVGLVGIVVIAPYTGDPYWDYVDASLMATLAFVTAPWAVATLWRARRTGLGPEVVAAVIVWLFSASWSYDGWILLRDGAYPLTWRDNLIASSCLYAFAGVFWGLDGREGRMAWAPADAAWPQAVVGGFRAIWPLAGAIMLFIALLMLSSVLGWV
ncbi:MAG: hypothetical protein H6704_11120 [Myxococcales bacterium]|nr:hypothetical protein [Myxococcales bacterium]